MSQGQVGYRAESGSRPLQQPAEQGETPRHDMHIPGEVAAFAGHIAWPTRHPEFRQMLVPGTPVVAPTRGAEGADVSLGRDILIGDQRAELAEQVVRMLSDDSLRQPLAERGRLLVEQRHNWNQIGQRFAEVVEDVAARAHRGNRPC